MVRFQEIGLKITLLGGVAHRLPVLVDHLAHVADALGALGLALVVAEDLGRTARAGVDRRANLTLPDAIAVADVHEGLASHRNSMAHR